MLHKCLDAPAGYGLHTLLSINLKTTRSTETMDENHTLKKRYMNFNNQIMLIHLK